MTGMSRITLEQLVAGSEDGYPRNVRAEVFPRLLKKGVLTGTVAERSAEFDDTPALRRTLGFGIEDFAYNTQGWCFAAVDAPVGRVADALRGHKAAVRYAPDVPFLAYADDLGVQPHPDRRDAFLVASPRSDWSVLVQTVHWIQGSDPLLALWLAADLSAALGTRALAMWDDDFSGEHLVLCTGGSRTAYLGDEVNGWEDVQAAVYEWGVFVPKCFVASGGTTASFHAAAAADVRRADHVVLAIPDGSRVRVPHALEKLGMLAQAVAEEPEDEAAFCNGMIDSLCQQASALRG